LESKEETIKSHILDHIYDQFGGVMGYVGNGGTDKLVGVSESGESIYPSDEYTFDEVEDEDGDEVEDEDGNDLE